MQPERTIDDIVRYCIEYKKKTGNFLHYGHAVAMIEREERIAKEKKKAAAKRRREKATKEKSKEEKQ